MIVVDTNIIGYLYLSNERASLAEQALRKDAHWVAPILWRSELRNVLTLYLRKRLLSLGECQQIMDQAQQMLQNREYVAASDHVLNLAASSECTAYDCEFVALAKDLNAPLVTVDRQILSQFPEVAVTLEEFVAR